MSDKPLKKTPEQKAEELGQGVSQNHQAEALQESRNITKVLFEISSTVNTIRDLNDLYVLIHQSLKKIIDATNLCVGLYDEKNGVLSFPYGVDQYIEEYPTVPADKAGGIGAFIYRVIEQNKPVLVDNPEIKEYEQRLGLDPIPPVEQRLGVPLNVSGKAVGAMVVQRYTASDPYTQEEVDLLSAVSHQVALAIERKDYKQAQHESEGMFRLISEQSLLGISIFQDGVYKYVNDATAEITEYSVDEMMGWKEEEFVKLIHPDDLDFVMEQFRKKQAGADNYTTHYTYRGISKSGKLKWIEQYSKSIIYQGRPADLVTTIDITERKKVEEQLYVSEEKYTATFKTSPDSVTITTMTGLFVEANDGYSQLSGHSIEESIGRTSTDINIWESLEDRKRFVSELNSKGYVKNMEAKFRRKDGSFYHTLVSASIIELDNTPHILLIAKDITDLKKTEEALKESQFLFTQMFEQSSTSMSLYNPEGTIISVNPAFCSMFGVKEEDITNGQYNIFKDREVRRSGVIQPAKELFERKKPGKWELRFDIGMSSRSTKVPTSKKNKVYLEVFGYPILNEEGELMNVVFQHYDVTEKKKTQELLIQNEKMVSIGGLAAGMAHEINNPLGGVLQGAQNIQRRLSSDLKANLTASVESGVDLQKLQVYLKKRGILSQLDGIINSGKKASKIISNMLQFSRKSESQMAPASLPDLVDNVLELAEKDYNMEKRYDFRNIEIIKEYQPNLPKIPITETEIEQVFLNLFNNAAWAMYEEEHPRIRVRITQEGNMIRVDIEDNGPGMDKETRKHIFEPFFTTKPVGEGTGLGLSVSYMIITINHNGTMGVESEVHNGTCFTIRLPVG